MYCVAKIYKSVNPLIVEVFDNLEDANDYAAILNRSGKGNYVVLQPVVTGCAVCIEE